MKYTEICLHCGDDYIPKRRGVQKFCSNSCRSRNWQERQPLKSKNPQVSLPAQEDIPPSPKSNDSKEKERMSWAGVGNAATGAAIVEIGKNIIAPPATKKDIQELKSIINGSRYLTINNMAKDNFGRIPYYDVETGYVVYFLV